MDCRRLPLVNFPLLHAIAIPFNGILVDDEDLQTLEAEIAELRDELLRVARLPWKPTLNDGVLFTVAPLYSLFRLGKWQKKLKETWDKLAKGDYDWAHLAHSIWTERVREKCRPA